MRKDLFFNAFLIITLFILLTGCGTETANISQQTEEKSSVSSEDWFEIPPELPPDIVIEMKEDGFFPKSLSVSVGTNVLFVNKGNEAIWPASDNHPTHTLYPGSSLQKCTPDPEKYVEIFDACHGIPPGGAWSFFFREKGTWGYHDHLHPKVKGVVVVS